MQEIVLNAAEQKLAHYLAKCRHEKNRHHGVSNARIGPQSDYETDLEGIAAEIAFCKVMNVYPDTQTDEWKDADAITPSMGAVDVKATKYKNGRLLVRTTKVDKAIDAYALMVGVFPRYLFAGWVPASELITEENIKDLGRGDTYVLDQNRLRNSPKETAA